MMKKLFLFLFTVVAFTACDKGGEGGSDKDIILNGGTSTTQTVYADQTGTPGGIRFTSTGAWYAEVSEVAAKADAAAGIDWLTLSQYRGDKAGDYTLTMTLTENYTGSDRKAKIRIVCGETVITISVEQKGKTQDGEFPDEPAVIQKLVSKIRITSTYLPENRVSVAERTLTYDNQNRVVRYEEVDFDEGGAASPDWAYTFSYSGNTITQSESETDDDYSYTGTTTYVLNDKNRVETWSAEETEIQNGEIRGAWKSTGTLRYQNDYLMQVDIVTESGHGDQVTVDNSTDFCKWENGNLIETGEKENLRYTTRIEYGDVENTGNVDFNYLLSQTEWLDCLAFEGDGIKAFGYIGKRSANLMSKEIDNYESGNYYTYEYELTDGLITEVVITGYDSDGRADTRKVCAITYINPR